ncbi:hypothetical protein SLEP1_g52018 [Rubroshorea leprosula]|uniref:Uncharacterized protein n=1 Tax=Rubroshorea leprosula TaxID=152421 RepID=A0AAV5M5W2_9ROSI|nr:hypothetical protein SLEP1_g52018 [Rubroshorea leprosula]
MAYEVKSSLRIETTGLLGVMGMLVALIIASQCLQLWYGNFMSSLFPSDKVAMAENSDFFTGRPVSESEEVANATHVSGLNSTGMNAPNETAHVMSSEVNGKDLNGDVVLQTNVRLNLNVSPRFDEGSKSGKGSSAETLELSNNSTMEFGQSSNDKSEAEEDSDAQETFSPENETMYGDFSNSNITERNMSSESNGYYNADLVSPVAASTLIDSSTNIELRKKADTNIRNPVMSNNSTTCSAEKNLTPSFDGTEKPVQVQDNLNRPSYLPLTNGPKVKERIKMPSSAVITIDEMNSLLHQSNDFYHSVVCLKVQF